MEARPPVPPFTRESAIQKVRGAEDAWNSRDPDRVAGVYTEDTVWRNRAEFPVGREAVRTFLQRERNERLHYRHSPELAALEIGIALLRQTTGSDLDVLGAQRALEHLHRGVVRARQFLHGNRNVGEIARPPKPAAPRCYRHACPFPGGRCWPIHRHCSCRRSRNRTSAP